MGTMNQMQSLFRHEIVAMEKRIRLYDHAVYALSSGICGDETQYISLEFDCLHLYDSFGDARATIENILRGF